MARNYVIMFWMMLNQGTAQDLAVSNLGFDFMGTPGSFIHLNNFQENRPTGYFHFRLKYDEVKGSPYWFPEKSEAALELNNGNFVTKVPVQYDAYSQEIIATQTGVGEFLIDTRYFQSMLVERDGRIVPFLKVHPENPKKFVEVVYESEDLYFFKDVHVSYNVQEIRMTGFLDEIKRFRRQDLYYILADGQLTRVKLKKKDILAAVPYQTKNTLTNTGQSDWKKSTGLLSIWLLGMYNALPATTVFIPFNPGSETEMGKPVTDDYFGKVPSERLVVKDSVIYFSGDAKFRSKIGLSPKRAKQLLGSYDATSNVLTIVKYNKPEGVLDYVNSLWELQEEPYKGDVINSYNDGPPAPGEAQLGQFYELETSSPALALKAGERATHVQMTCHF